MHTVIVSTTESPKDKKPNRASLVKALNDEKKRKLRVFHTYVAGDPAASKWFVFVTASKDIHLRLGSFQRATLFILGRFLKEEFANLDCSQILLVFKDATEEREEGILITKTMEGDDFIFTISPTH